jgi:predicted ATP-grasp superfamily ATP-dependent carboligase
MSAARFPRPAGRTARLRRAGVGAVVLGGDYQGLAIARSLGRHGVPICVIDDERSIATVSRFTTHRLRVPDLRSAEASLEALETGRRRFGLDGWVLYPTRDETVACLALHRDELARHFRVPTPPWTGIEQAWDKRRTYQLAETLGIPVPRTWCPATEADLAAVDTSVPLMVKPAIKEHFFYATRVKGWRVETRAELHDAFRRGTEVIGTGGELLVQEMIPGGGAEQRSYCAFFKDGTAVASMTVVRRRQHPSDLGRASTYVETADVPEVAAPSQRLLSAMGYYGLVEVEYKRDPRDGVHKLLDVNARTWGFVSLGAAAGVDFPYLLYRDQVGDPVAPVAARPGIRWLRLVTDVPNAARDLRRGDLDLRRYVASLRGVDVEAVFSLQDPVPGVYELALTPYLAMRRGL